MGHKPNMQCLVFDEGQFSQKSSKKISNSLFRIVAEEHAVQLHKTNTMGTRSMNAFAIEDLKEGIAKVNCDFI